MISGVITSQERGILKDHFNGFVFILSFALILLLSCLHLLTKQNIVFPSYMEMQLFILPRLTLYVRPDGPIARQARLYSHAVLCVKLIVS